jgi:threonine dehydrogenase-like Zn-dependent dehydrogenase
MKAVGVFPKEKAVRLVDHPEPQISRPDEVKLRMLEVGVCGTDRELASFAYGTAPSGSDYFVLGHEGLAEVVDTGAAVRSVTPGDLVTPAVRHPCGKCVPCGAGRQDFCTTDEYRERGIKDMHGFMTEFVIDREPFLHVLPPGLRDVGVLVEPLTIAEKAWLEHQAIQQRLPFLRPPATALVLGAGPASIFPCMMSRRNASPKPLGRSI